MTLIAVIGAAYAGRGSLAEQIEVALEDRGIAAQRTTNLDETGRALGFPMGTRTTAATAKWAMTAGATAALIAKQDVEVVISEYCPLESLAWWLAAVQQRREQPDEYDWQRLSALATVLAADYSLTVFTGFAGDTTSGARRDQRFRADVEQHLDALLHKSGIPFIRASDQAGDRQEVVAQAVDTAEASRRPITVSEA